MMPSPLPKALVGQLLDAMDEQIALLGAQEELLRMLSAAIVAHDEAAMAGVLEAMERQQLAQSAGDGRLAALRQMAASACGINAGKLRLADVARRLDADDAATLRQRRSVLMELALRVRRAHAGAAVLLREAARVNRMLLEGMLQGSDGLTTYGGGGTTDPWQPSSGLVDAEL